MNQQAEMVCSPGSELDCRVVLWFEREKFLGNKKPKSCVVKLSLP